MPADWGRSRPRIGVEQREQRLDRLVDVVDAVELLVAQAHLRGVPQLIVPDKPRAIIAKAAPGSSGKMKSSRVSLAAAAA